MSISIITAMDLNCVIGNENKLPWHIPGDLKRFKSITTGKSIVMGRKTFESIGKPLPNRKNIVLSKNKDLCYKGIDVVDSIGKILNLSNQNGNEIIIIGGRQIYELFLPYVNKIYLTVINSCFKGDIKFPDINLKNWSVYEFETIEEENLTYNVFVLQKDKLLNNILEYKDLLPLTSL